MLRRSFLAAQSFLLAFDFARANDDQKKVERDLPGIEKFLTPEIQKKKEISFEAIGGIGDGDPKTGNGSDNADAFRTAQLFGEKGYKIIFGKNKAYKTTEQIPIHNMHWIGDANNSPIIFGWFRAPGKKIIGRSKSENPCSATIDGLSFFRCGPHAEHGIVVDNMASFYFNGVVDGVPGAQGGAIGVSPFYPERRPSKNCHISAKIKNSGDYGVQFGAVQGGSIRVDAEDCYREVIGIEPIIRGVIKFEKNTGDRIFSPHHGLATGDPLIYYANNSKSILNPADPHLFAVVFDENSFGVALNSDLAAKGEFISLGLGMGEQWMIRCATVENIDIKDSIIRDYGSQKPSLYANTTGYVVFTGNSGGYMKNISVSSLNIICKKRNSAKATIGILMQGARDIHIRAPQIQGCDKGIVMKDGYLNGLFFDGGGKIPLPKRAIKSFSLNNLVDAPKISEFNYAGVVVERGTRDRNRLSNGSFNKKSSLIPDILFE